jgi:outer membrane lipoprotein-sorting protein
MRCLILICFLFCKTCFAQQDAREIFDHLLASIKTTQTCSYNFVGEDFFNGERKVSEFIIHLQAQPFKVYMYSIQPHAGARGLYVDGENENKILIYPNSFPYINLNFSPYHSMMRKGHHFTMLETGFTYLQTVLEFYFYKDSVAFLNALSLCNDEIISARPCYCLQIVQPLFGYVNYKAASGETLLSIAKKFMLSDDMLSLANNGLNATTELKAGQILSLPNAYAKKMLIYVDKQNFLPLRQEIYDEKGIFGRYTISSLVKNPVFDKDEFTKSKKEYGF